jgi:hypothetical protein
MFSMAFLKFVAETGVERARDEEQHRDADVDEIVHGRFL